MDIKILLIMGLLSFGLGGCCNAQNKQGNSNVKELSKEQKEDLKKMYEMYQYFKMKPGIPEDADVKERTEPLPWIEMEKDFDWNPIKEWLSNAQLDFGDFYMMDGRLSLHGKYVPDKDNNETYESLQKESSENPYELKLAPIGMFGNMRGNLISHLKSTDGDTLKFSGFSRLDFSDNKQELALLFKPIYDYADSADFEGGSIEIELFPPLRWKHAHISLLPEDEGKEYEFDGVKFKVFKSSPGDVILEYDEKYSEQMDKLEIILIKGQKLIDRCKQYTSGGEEVLQVYRNPDMGFGEWCATFLGENSESLGTTPEALKLATKEHYQPTSEELRHFHETAGKIVGHQLTDILMDINSPNYKEFYQQWVKKGYEAAVEFKGSYIDAMGSFYERYGNDSKPYIGFLRGVSIGSSYVKANLKPDWDIINRCAIDFLDKYNSADEDSLYSIVQKHTEEYIDPIVTRREILSFLTEKDIKYLSKEVIQDISPNMYCWYKTNTEADAMYIYKPDDSTSNKPLIKVRYQLGGDKPEIISPE